MKLTNDDLNIIARIMKSAVKDSESGQQYEVVLSRLCIACYKAGVNKGISINKE
ncbi:hypothetical protein [Veillonella sp. R32]|uniref:hypothetical protein n=1 Tax=Veillonella sp. R32 TaxID=2021312 RepID=UPI0013896C4B|nr:hypothetical protein [Veillonella sp. R32]